MNDDKAAMRIYLSDFKGRLLERASHKAEVGV